MTWNFFVKKPENDASDQGNTSGKSCWWFSRYHVVKICSSFLPFFSAISIFWFTKFYSAVPGRLRQLSIFCYLFVCGWLFLLDYNWGIGFPTKGISYGGVRGGGGTLPQPPWQKGVVGEKVPRINPGQYWRYLSI